jgi:hypothetical protein
LPGSSWNFDGDPLGLMVYTAANADQALEEPDRFDTEWGARYPATVKA